MLSTFLALSYGAIELNPIIKLGATVFFGLKIILPTIVTLLFLIANDYIIKNNLDNVDNRFAINILKFTLVILNIMWLIVIINNIFVLFNQSGLGYGLNFINFK